MLKKLLMAALLVASTATMAQEMYGPVAVDPGSNVELYNPEPVIVRPGFAPTPPVYLYVSPEYRMHWGRYCNIYQACGRPVYFVRDSWYHSYYYPRYYGHPGYGPGWHDHGFDHGHEGHWHH